MKRTTVMLPDNLATLLDLERRRRDVSAAEIVREALDAYFHRESPPIMRIAALGRSGRSDISMNVEEILAAEWGSEEGQNRLMFGTPTRPESHHEAEAEAEATSTPHKPPTPLLGSAEPALEDPL